MNGEIWVWISRGQEGQLAPVAEELLHEAHGLCRRLGARMVALADFEPAKPVRERLEAWGMAEFRRAASARFAPHPVVNGKDPLFLGGRGLGGKDRGKPDGEATPRAFLFAADSFGRVAAPLWSARSDAILVTGATGVTADHSNFVVSRPTYGDQFEALVRIPLGTPLVVTLLPGAVGNLPPPVLSLGLTDTPSAGAGDAPSGAESGVEDGEANREGSGVFRLHPPDPATLDIADAERVVAFGRGAFHVEAVALVEQLAERLGAVIAGTRPAADEGWLPFSRQVGLTGAIVRPKLYVAVGISGAPYHMVGVKGPEHLLAINNDPEAPIFGSADLAITGNLYEVLPRLIAELDAGGDLGGKLPAGKLPAGKPLAGKPLGGPKAGRRDGG